MASTNLFLNDDTQTDSAYFKALVMKTLVQTCSSPARCMCL